MDTVQRAVQPGDVVVIQGHRVGDTALLGEILDVLPHERYRIRWEDGHESTLHPGSDAIIRPATHHRASGRTKK
jgi:hypothetical protein